MKKVLLILFTQILFLHSAHAVGFRFSPIGAIVGLADVSLDLGLGSYLRLTPTLVYWDLTLEDDNDNEFTIDILGYGGELTFHPSGNFSDGFYFGAYTTQGSFEYKNEQTNLKGEADIKAAGGLIGYQWVWTSFVMNLAFKAGTNTGDDEITLKNADTDIETGDTEPLPHSAGGIEFKLGWFF